MSDPSRADLGNAIIAGIASGATALEQMSAIMDHIHRAGFAVVPRVVTAPMRVAAVNTLPPMKMGDPPLYESLWWRMIDAAEKQ